MIISDLQVAIIILPDEVCPVLAGGGVTRLGEAAAHPEPQGAAPVRDSAPGGALSPGEAGA